MIKKYLFIPIVVLISLCGGEADNAEVVETTENTVNTNVEQPTVDLLVSVQDNDSVSYTHLTLPTIYSV